MRSVTEVRGFFLFRVRPVGRYPQYTDQGREIKWPSHGYSNHTVWRSYDRSGRHPGLSDGPDGARGLSALGSVGRRQNDALGWLQSTSRPEVALAVVTPRRFVPDYQVRIVRSELAPLAIHSSQDAKVLVIVGKNDSSDYFGI